MLSDNNELIAAMLSLECTHQDENCHSLVEAKEKYKFSFHFLACSSCQKRSMNVNLLGYELLQPRKPLVNVCLSPESVLSYSIS